MLGTADAELNFTKFNGTYYQVCMDRITPKASYSPHPNIHVKVRSEL